MFGKNIPPKGHLKFVIKETLILVLTNYVHISKKNVSVGLIDKLLDKFLTDFKYSLLMNNNGLRDFIFGAAKDMLHILNNPKCSMGFCFFAINLIIKRLTPFVDSNNLSYLDAPLNKDELTSIGSKYKSISSIANGTIYKNTMDLAHKYANSQSKSLYDWELDFYNK